MPCIFCQIIQRRIPTDIVYQDKELIVFKDIKPNAAVHLLIVPKKHIESVNDLKEQDKDLIAKMIFLAKELARQNKISQGYRLVFNVGRGGGQIIDHLHLHLIGGGELK